MYPEVYCSTDRRGLDLRSTFHLVFKTYKDKKKLEQSGKNPQNYTIKKIESFVFEQKPIEFDTINVRKRKKLKKELKKERKNDKR